MAEVVILGAGLTGLSCAYHLEKQNYFDFKIFEKNKTPGGLLRSFTQDGFTFDFTGHLLHVSDSYFLQFLDTIAGLQNFNLVSRKSAIHTHNTLTPYPFQMNLHGLPSNVIVDAIHGFITRKKSLCPKSFYDWVLKYFGQGFAKHFFVPYNSKLLAYDVKKVTPSWTGRFIPKTDLKTMLYNAITPPIKQKIGYNQQFYYPKSGGIEFLIKRLKEKMTSPVHTEHNAIHIDTKTKVIYFENGHKENYKTLVTTLPLDNLLKQLYEPASSNLQSKHKKLLCTSVLNFNLGFDSPFLSNNHWHYYPEKQYHFYRIGFWHNINKSSAPQKKTGIYGELAFLQNSKTKKQITNLNLTYPQLVLGCQVEIKNIDGHTLQIKVPKGCPVGKEIVIPGKGFPLSRFL